ncbi:hypothetical protein AD947_04275 [Acetobacter tropicalis]|uniref:Uncharacterized protein n=1 Tax=Acetobacter tropicalis TaxID=104102 RepID=A0A149U1J9_9PROT|nr:hypothetical protein [Acetobacter tropicalis]KXV59345.1 hypothetical protein AD947_04275 [Acetobacter tropicalis]
MVSERTETKPTPRAAWFAPKRFGYGAGTPITWQGWATLGLFLAVTLGSSFALPFLPFRHTTSLLVGVILLDIIATALFFWVCRSHTQGGWRWRWGESD